MAGAQVVIDLANSPSFEDKAVLEFFETSGRNCPRLSDDVGDLIPLLEALYCNAQIICCIATWMSYGWSP